MARGLDTDIPSVAGEYSLATAEALPILVVDDRRENLVALEAVLAPLGLPVITATSGEDALRLLLERDFALILLDVRMPGLGGIETAQMIKGRARTRDVPIVFLTAAQGEVDDMLRGYGVGAVDYVLKPVDPELLRSKVAVFAELEQGRRALRQSEALLRGAFDAAPIGKTVLDVERKVVKANRAFARMAGREPHALAGAEIAELSHADDRAALSSLLDRLGEAAASETLESGHLDGPDLRLVRPDGTEVWVAPTASLVAVAVATSPLLLIQWVDVGTRRRAEQDRAELLLEHAARTHAEAQAERLQKLHRLVEAIASSSMEDLLGELARRLIGAFDADAAEVQVDQGRQRRSTLHARGEPLHRLVGDPGSAEWREAALTADGTTIGAIRIGRSLQRAWAAGDDALLRDAAEQVSLVVRRMQLHEQEHRIAVELQRGLLPPRLPELPGLAIAAHYEAAGLGAEVGGDWYDVFALSDECLGVVIGDVTGSGIQAASAMGQLRSVTRAFAVTDPDSPSPAEVLTRLHRFSQRLGFEDLFTILYLILDRGRRTVTYANAGHPPPLLRQSDGEVRVLHGGESMMCNSEVTYQDHHAVLGEGDTLVLYTDGLIERRGEVIDAGLQRLAAAIEAGPSDVDALCAHILGSAPAPETQLHDDVTAVVVRLTSEAPGEGGDRHRDARAKRVAVTLAPDAFAPSAARALLRRTFGDAVAPDELDRATLALSELTTNAVEHGQGEVTIRAHLNEERLLVEVIDQGSGFEGEARQRDFGELGGWGLNIVDVEASRWGMHEGTTHVWFEVERRGPRLGVDRRPSAP